MLKEWISSTKGRKRMSGTLDQILNIVIPIIIFMVVCWMFYRTPLIKQMVDGIIEKIGNWRENKAEKEVEIGINQYISYE